MSESLNQFSTYSTTRRVVKNIPHVDGVLLYPDTVKQGGLRKRNCFKRSELEKPLVTIVTVVYNGAPFIEKTIRSILSQNYDNIEYIIVDGGSNDGTLDIIKSFDDCIDYWISERDFGVYDAMNKALGLFTGEWVNFMNCGDFLLSNGTVSSIVEVLNNSSSEIITGNVRIVDSKGAFTNRKHPHSKADNTKLMKYNCIAHQATFVKKSVVQKVGVFNPKFRIHGDYDYWIRAIKIGISLEYVDMDVANFCNDGISSNRELVPVAIRERFNILENAGYINSAQSCIYTKCSVFYFNLKSLIRFLIGKK